MGKKKDLSVLDTPRRRSRRLMKLNTDDNPAEDFDQLLDSSPTDLMPTKVIRGNIDEAAAGNGDDDSLEALAKDVFKNMKAMLVNSQEDVAKAVPTSGEHEPELLTLENVKMPSKKIQM